MSNPLRAQAEYRAFLGSQLIKDETIHLNVSEFFGPTIQGEGPNAGQLSSFLRLSGCNLTCSWCDSAYTWDWTRFNRSEEVTKITVADMVDHVAVLPGRLIITGGEPLLQAPHLARLLDRCQHRTFDVETNGTRPLGDTAPYWDTIICSPKIIPSADQPVLARDLDPSITGDPRSVFKFVVADQPDLDAVDAFVQDRGLPVNSTWLMPEGTDTDTLTARLPWLMDAAVERGYNITSRLHVYGWGDGRGH